jgi:metallo-beta-lactamase class B
LSPSLWFTDDIYTFVETTGRQAPQRYFLLAGYGENTGSVSVTDDVLAMEQTLLTAGFTADELERVFHADGQHSEWYWAREFGAAYQWLFAEAPNRIARYAPAPLRLWPVPTRDTLQVDLPVPGLTRAWLYDQNGRSLGAQRLDEGRLDVSALPAGLYWLRLRSGRQHWVGRLVKVE